MHPHCGEPHISALSQSDVDVSFFFSQPVNNAGIGLVGPLESIPIEEMKKVFETNFFGVIRMIKEVMPDMKQRKGGHILVISSVMGLQGKQTEA